MMRHLLLLAALARPAPAQNGSRAAADSAWARGDSAAARLSYEERVRRNPEDSRSVYRLARLTRDSDSARALYLRYTELEPDDAWGWLALGTSLMERGEGPAAERAWDEALRLGSGEPEIREGRAGFDRELGRYWLRAGRPRRAASAFERVPDAQTDPDIARRWKLARALARPALEPIAGYQRDSDDNSTRRVGLRGDLALADGVRLGGSAALATISNGLSRVSARDGGVTLSARPNERSRLELGLGGVRFDPDSLGSRWTTVTGSARFRWTGRGGGTAFETGARRLPLATTPELVVNQAVRTEARILAQVPVGRLRLRGEGRSGVIEVPGLPSNRRWALDGTVVLPLGWRGELSLQGHRQGYRDSSSVGYFAADRVETVEIGSYLELGDGGPWSLVLDLGAGGQRIQRFGETTGRWGAALRGWSWITYALGAGRMLQLEIEGYNAPGAGVVAPTPDWRHFSIALSTRLAL